MQSWCFLERFGLDGLRLMTGEIPTPGPNDVLLEMRAASLNFRDLVVLRGEHGRAVKPPLIPLSDGVGRVAAIGSRVRSVRVGERVAPVFFQHWHAGAPPRDLEAGRLGGPLDGVLTTHRVVPADAVVAVPDHLSDLEASTLACAGVTAWSALNEPDPVRPGETVLILGSGGVAIFAVQFARRAGARVIVTTSSAGRASRLEALGADLVIDRTDVPDWAMAVRDATGGAGCDRVLELGGAQTLAGSIRASRTGGTVVMIGNVTGNMAELFLPVILTRQLTLRAVTVGSRAAFVAMNRAIALHRMRPVVARRIAFEDAPMAFEALREASIFGKICIAIAPDGGP